MHDDVTRPPFEPTVHLEGDGLQGLGLGDREPPLRWRSVENTMVGITRH